MVLSFSYIYLVFVALFTRFYSLCVYGSLDMFIDEAWR